MQRRQDRVLGPYGPDARGRWRYITIIAGERISTTCESKSQAEAEIADARAALKEQEETTVRQAIDRFSAWLVKRGRSEGTGETTTRTLEFFFEGHEDQTIADLTPAQGARIYQQLQQRNTRFGRPPSGSTHRQALMQAKALLKWAVREKLHPGPSPLAEIEPEGQLHHGKPQLRVDEARKWLIVAQGLAFQERGAAMSLVCLLLGLRPGECAGLTVRDLDDAGRLLWVKGKAKPNKPPAYRPVDVADQLIPVLQFWARDKLPAAPLFGLTRNQISRWTRKICTLAEVPIPKDDWRQLCGHSLRGLHATIAVQAGATSHIVSAALGNTPAVLARSYVAPGAQESADQQRAALRLVK